jgi:monoamine oxidase
MSAVVNNPDVIVIGAGVAGLAAGERLAGAGRRVLVLEGRARAGGRIETHRLPGWPVIEAGAEFMHGVPPALERVRRQAGLRRVEVQQRRLYSERGRLARAEGAFRRAMALLEHLPQEPPDRSYAQLAREPWWRRLADARVHRLARGFVEGFNAAAADDIGVLGLAHQTAAAGEIDGDRAFHIQGGYDLVVQALCRALARAGGELRLGATVHAVRWRPGRVEVHARGPLGTPLRLTARQAVITLPLGVLQARPPAPAAVRFTPTLPPATRAAIGGLRAGPVLRVALRFAAHAPGLARRSFSFLHTSAAIFSTFWRPDHAQSPAPTVIAWAAGPAARQLASTDAPDRIRQAVSSLARALAVPPRALTAALQGALVFDWQADPYARGAYSYAPPDAASLFTQLSTPIADTLYFAGEATHPTAPGTVHGALETALTTAKSALAPTSRRPAPHK